MKQAKRAIKEDEKKDWEKLLQLGCLKALAEENCWGVENLMFHGGTSLRLSWGSPRASEDLDFMIAEGKVSELPKIMKKIFANLEANLQAIDPSFNFRFTEKARRLGELQNYMLVLESPNIHGSAKVKLEFWSVANDFLHKYKSTFKSPRDPKMDVRMYTEELLPVAELQSAYCDKLVALSTRPFFKWRDFFDIWWLRVQNNLDPLKDEKFMEFFQHNLQAYSVPEGFTLQTSLERYLNLDKPKLMEDAKTELQKWLPEKLWAQLYPDTVKTMLDLVEQDAGKLLSLLPTETLGYTRRPSCKI